MYIVGDMADKIKNNMKQPIPQFAWKVAFPKEFPIENIPSENIALLNEGYLRLRCEFTINPRENTIQLSPQTPYKPDQIYFFWVRYNRKDFCVAFSVTEEDVTEESKIQTFDQETSLQMLKRASRRYARKAERIAAKNTPEPAAAAKGGTGT